MASVAAAHRWSTTRVYGFEKYAVSARVTPQRRHALHLPVSIGPVTLTVLFVTVISGLAILSLLHSNVTATKGYQFRSVQSEHEELADQTKTLRMRVAELQALQNLDGAATGMVVARDITRVRADQRVALR